MISLIYNFKPRPLQISATSLLVLDVTKPSNYNDFSYHSWTARLTITCPLRNTQIA